MTRNTGSNLSRRELLKGAACGFGGLRLARLAAGTVPVQPAESGPGNVTVPKRPFGKIGLEVPILGLGGMFDIPSNQLMLHQAIKWGITYWDTADCYGGGRSEEGIGKFFAKQPERRKEIFLVSKSCAREPDEVGKLLQRSLERMKTDYIDLYFLHGVETPKELKDELARWAEQAKAAGKIKWFGLSTHQNMESCMLEAARVGWIDAIMMSYNYRLMHQPGMQEAVAACRAAGIGLTAMKTQGGGPVQQDSTVEMELAGRFLEKGFTDKQAKLVAVWQEPALTCICSQMPNLTILAANAAAALNKTSLGAGDLELLKRYVADTRSSYCAGCGELCRDAVADAVPVCDILRFMMYYRNYEDPERARGLFQDLPESTRRRLPTVDYAEAERRCPNRLPIARLMREALTLLG